MVGERRLEQMMKFPTVGTKEPQNHQNHWVLYLYVS